MSLSCLPACLQVASTEIIDRRTPNAEVCMAYGYSAMVFDQRVFVTYNPFNLYVTQPEVKPGCILRRSNFNVLEREKLVDSKQVGGSSRGNAVVQFSVGCTWCAASS